MERRVKSIINGDSLTKEEVKELLHEDLEELCHCANQLRIHYCGNQGELCSIINGKSGNCTEDCSFCAQSCHHTTGVATYEFMPKEDMMKDCDYHKERGVNRYSIVTSGRSLDDKSLGKVCEVYEELARDGRIKLCASHGLLKEEEFLKLKKSGVIRYHCNLETSRRYFHNICTTHTFDDKVENIKRAKRVGLEVCSGGILGMGETWEDRIDMAFSLAKLEVDSIPLNILIPVHGTPLEGQKPLKEEEILRTIAIFRFVNPKAQIRLAGGRILLKDSGKRAFLSGVNGAITGDMLTTSGNRIIDDQNMLQELGYEL